ncbi:MAG: SlyX family protein [Phycisphaeraceae bacterium]
MQHDDRLTLIEEKLAHLEKYVGDLDDVVRDLGARVAAQKDGVTAVRKMLEDHLSEADGPTDPIDDKPPHW